MLCWTGGGGFFRPRDQYKSDDFADLLTRWFQYSTFCPIQRIHGYQSETEFWKYPKAVDTLVAYDKFRYRLLPYLYSLAWRVTHDGDTMMRALPMDFAADAKARYDEFDDRPNNRDPSKCKALLAFPGDGGTIRAVFWSAKMSIDADGPAAGTGHKNGKDLDPDGQNVTSFRFSNGKSLPAEAVPYIVLPENEAKKGPFDPAVAIGDVAIVIFKDMITAAICGDLGPSLRRAVLVDHPRRVQRHQSCRLHLGPRVRDPVLDRLLLGQQAPVREPRERTLAQHVECSPALAEPSHAVVDAPGAQAFLRDHERLALAAERVRDRDANVLVQDLRVHGVAADAADVAQDVQSRRALRHDDHRHPLVRRDVGVREAHHDQEVRP